MSTYTHTTFDSDGNVIEERIIEVPENPAEAADREFRAALEAATSIADLKAALLGTQGPGAEPRRPTR